MMQITSVVLIVVIVLGCSCLELSLLEQKITFRNVESETDNSCNTPNGVRGECIDILTCPALLALIGKRDQHEFLKQSRCGWDGDLPLVCCGDESSKNKTSNCTASEQQWCGPDKVDKCCVPEVNYNIQKVLATAAIPFINSSSCEVSSIPPEPLSGCCGEEASNLKTIPGEVTSLEQYPWTAIIEYAWKDFIKMKCGGALISGRYVLTAAHCLFIDNWTPINIRLGDYDIDHPGIDCVENESGGQDCTDKAVTIVIEKTIPHPDYNCGSRAQTDDIALIRLQDNAPYTDFIRPICLPSTTSDFMETAESSTKLYVAGWELMSNVESHTQFKQQMELPFVSEENCFMSYRRLNIIIDEARICAGGENGKNSCKGDSGGPLMLVNNQTTEIVGIFSFSSCGRTSRPAVYTKVFHYLPWIRTNIN